MNRFMRGTFRLVETTTFHCNHCSRELRTATKSFCQSVSVGIEDDGHYSLQQLLQARCEVVNTTGSLCPQHQFAATEATPRIHSHCKQVTYYGGEIDQLILLFNSPLDMNKPTVTLPRILRAKNHTALFPELVPDALYGLAGVIVHEVGHYYAFRHHQTGFSDWPWMKFDDSKVTPHHGSEYLGPRLALYQRISDKDPRWAKEAISPDVDALPTGEELGRHDIPVSSSM